jgi:proteasome lid subunit RPN8/RPN11
MVARRVELTLPDALVEQLVAHARAGYPEEVCGLVAGRGGAAVAVYPGRNISLSPRVAYEMDVETLARLIEFEEAGLELLAIYHSHPHGPEGPSETDIEKATYPEAAYIIVSLADQKRPVMRAYRIG